MPKVEEILNSFGKTVVQALGKALPESKDATGELRDSIRFEVRQNGFAYSFKLYIADYYKWVDEGRKPGGKQPPPETLIQWIGIKRLVFRTGGGFDIKKQGDKRKKVSESTKVKSLAFVMGRKIAREGIKGTGFYTNTITPELIDQLKKDIFKAVGKEVKITLAEK